MENLWKRLKKKEIDQQPTYDLRKNDKRNCQEERLAHSNRQFSKFLLLSHHATQRTLFKIVAVNKRNG